MNPFEIRLDLLKMAQKYYVDSLELNTKYVLETARDAFKAGKITFEEFLNHVPDTFDVSDIVKKAQELNEFVKTTK